MCWREDNLLTEVGFKRTVRRIYRAFSVRHGGNIFTRVFQSVCLFVCLYV